MRKFVLAGSLKGILPGHAKLLTMRVRALDLATGPEDLIGYPGWKVHRLKGARKREWAMWVNGNWRLTWTFVERNVEELNYEDYHGE